MDTRTKEFNGRPQFSLPCNIWLELESVTPYIHPESQS
jgi:hypothetical protein